VNIPSQLCILFLKRWVNRYASGEELAVLSGESAKRVRQLTIAIFGGFVHRHRRRKLDALQQVVGATDDQQQGRDMFHGGNPLGKQRDGLPSSSERFEDFAWTLISTLTRAQFRQVMATEE
jgi:hypothetical protein